MDVESGVRGAISAFVDITERKRAEAQREILVAELSHRVKNALATVIAIQQHSFTRANSPADARRSFEARIHALAQTHTRLAEENWSGVSISTLAMDELRPYRAETGNNVRLSGPLVILRPNAGLTLGLGFHELATNAAKYGALSTTHGHVDVTWSVREGWVEVTWKERGGPTVYAPQRSGFGRLLIERGLVADLGGTVRLQFEPGGVVCVIGFAIRACVK